MKLEHENGVKSSEATEADVRAVFADDAGRGSFVILSESDQVYMQAAGEGGGPFTLEYREGDESRHYHCLHTVARSVAEAAFLKYLQRDATWKTDFRWRHLEEKPWWKIW
ncbi:MAG: hypothetical protein U0529_08745 [Thermoanaerobaculia bacterium]